MDGVRHRDLAAHGLARRLREMVRDDYIAGRTVNLSGWIVSRTEGCIFARLSMCAHMR